MADELTPEMLQEAQPDLLTLEDEDGKECTFEVIDATEVNGTRYLAVIPYQEDPESLDERGRTDSDADRQPMRPVNIWTLWMTTKNFDRWQSV